MFTLDEVDASFWKITQLKFDQAVKLKKNVQDGKEDIAWIQWIRIA